MCLNNAMLIAITIISYNTIEVYHSYSSRYYLPACMHASSCFFIVVLIALLWGLPAAMVMKHGVCNNKTERVAILVRGNFPKQ